MTEIPSSGMPDDPERLAVQRSRHLREQGFAYDGLRIHIMEHNTEKGISLLCKRLEQEGKKYGSF